MRQRGFEIAKGFEDKDINLPVRKTKNSSGYDIEIIEDVTIKPFKEESKPYLLPTGIKAYMQSDEVLVLYPRSSTFKKYGLSFPHSAGIIDSDYYNNVDNDGHIMIQVINLTDKEVLIKKHTPLAQGIFQKYLTADDDNSSAERIGGIGSTDK